MKNQMHIISITEKSEKKDMILDQLKRAHNELVSTDSLLSGLTLMKAHTFNLVLISYDFEDSYSVSMVLDTLTSLPEIQKVLLLTERGVPLETELDEKVMPILIEDPQGGAAMILSIIDNQLDELDRAMKSSRRVETGTPLIDSVPLGLFRTNPEGDFIETNKQMASLLKAPFKDVIYEDNFFSFFNDEEEKKVITSIISQEGQVQGRSVEIQRYDGVVIWARINLTANYGDDQSIISIEGTFEDITFQKELEQKLSFLSNHDILTGLPNKNFFQLQAELTLSQARYTKDLVTFFIIELDKFTMINERYGRNIGDEVLKLATARMKQLFRKSDLLARYEGSTFLVLLPSITSRKDILAVAEKLTQGFKDPIVFQHYSIDLQVNIGIAIYPTNGDQVLPLINRAYNAMNTVKEREPGGYMISTYSV